MATVNYSERLRRVRRRMLAREPWCAYCGVPLDEQTSTLDHVKPRSAGGSDRRSNLWLACEPCNQTKGCHRLEVLACPRERGGKLLLVWQVSVSLHERTPS